MNSDFKMPSLIYGAKLKDKKKLMQSQSGGAFAAIAEYFLEQEAIVYGCGMDENHNAIYKRITDKSSLDDLKGSKYVQADLGNTLKQIKADLDNGAMVLFSGTPCYVSAVKKFVSSMSNRDNLYTVDIICHGVPSPLIYRTYIKELEERLHSKICKFVFRDKLPGGWHHHMEKIIYENGKVEVCDNYTKIFYTNLALRPSCGKCIFARIERVSDFTIGDFWGIQNICPEFDDKRGVSIIFCNTNRAVAIFDCIRNDFELLNTDVESALQPNLKKPSKIPKCRKLFWNDFHKHGIMYCAKKWPPIIELPTTIKKRIKKYLKR